MPSKVDLYKVVDLRKMIKFSVNFSKTLENASNVGRQGQGVQASIGYLLTKDRLISLNTPTWNV